MAEPSKKAPQYIAALAACLGAFALGTVIGWGSPTEGPIHFELNYERMRKNSTGMPPFKDLSSSEIDRVKHQDDFEKLYNDPTLAQLGWIGSIFTLGAATVMFPLSVWLDRLGRKTVMLLLVIPFFAGWVIICAATALQSATIAIAAYCVGRYITGFCAGAFCVAAPVFIGEVAEKEIRGTLGIFFQLLLVFGIFYAYLLGKMSVLYISIACGIVPVIFGIIFFFIPESPYFLLMRNKTEAATKAMQWFRGKNYDISGEMKEAMQTIAEAEAQKGSLKEKMKKPAAKKSLMIGIGLMLCQQLCGINAVIFHAEAIFSAANEGDKDPVLKPYVSQLIMGVIQIVATGAAAIVVSRLGNKLLLLISFGVMGVCHLGMGLYFFMADKDASSVASLSWLPVLMLCLFIMAFSFGAGPVPWSMMGELFPSEIKGFAASICSFVNWMLAFLVSFTFHFIVEGIGRAGPFLIFAVLCALAFAFVLFFCMETKGKTLAEIQAFLGATKTPAGAAAAAPQAAEA